MDYDENTAISIYSFNSARKGFCSMSLRESSKYLRYILNDAQPDICLLPGDSKALKYSGCENRYRQYGVPTLDGTVLLYSSRVDVNKPDINFTTFRPLPGIDFDKLVCPRVAIRAPAPLSHIVKEFNIVTWKHTLYTESKIDVRAPTESIILFGQQLAIETERGVFICGEMTVDAMTVQPIVKKLNENQRELFLSALTQDRPQVGYLPNMMSALFRAKRHLFEMKVFKCDARAVNESNSAKMNNLNNNEADCFIASKDLELTKAELVNVEDCTARSIKMCPPPLKEHAPTKTQLIIAPRPPRHHGG